MILSLVVAVAVTVAGCSGGEKPEEQRASGPGAGGDDLLAFPDRPRLPSVKGAEPWGLDQDAPGGSDLPELRHGTVQDLRQAQQAPDTREGAERFATAVSMLMTADLPTESVLPALEKVAPKDVVQEQFLQSQGLPFGRYVPVATEVWLRSREVEGGGWDVALIVEKGIDGVDMGDGKDRMWLWDRHAMRVMHRDGAWWVVGAEVGMVSDERDPTTVPEMYQKYFDDGGGWRKTRLVP